jgi:hypothetical protein
MKTYEIHDLTTNEILADNLSFDDLSELFGAYVELYPTHEIVSCCRTTKKPKTHKVSFRIEFQLYIMENYENIY